MNQQLIGQAEAILKKGDRTSAALKQMQALYKEALKSNDDATADYISNLIEAFLVDGGAEAMLEEE